MAYYRPAINTADEIERKYPQGMTFGQAQMERLKLALRAADRADAKMRPLPAPPMLPKRAIPAAPVAQAGPKAAALPEYKASAQSTQQPWWWQLPGYELWRKPPPFSSFMDHARGLGYADGGFVSAHPLYQKYLLAMQRAGLADLIQPPEAIIPRLAQYEAAQRLALANQTVAGGTQPYAEGGKVTGPGTGKSDSIPAIIDNVHPAAVSNGEFIFPKKAVEFYGTKVLDAMVQKAKQAAQLRVANVT